MELTDKLQALAMRANQTIQEARSLDALEDLRVAMLGRKGELTELLKEMAQVSAEDRPKIGAMVNDVKQTIEKKLDEAHGRLAASAVASRLSAEQEDVTEPGMRPPEGHLHIMTQAMREITEIFHRIGFVRTRYPEVEWDWYAFEALNMPKDHPARDDWETFFMDAPTSSRWGKMLLTPHTSSGQIREMQTGKLPIRMINIAKAYRRQIDATHVPMFHQFEGLYIDKGVAITHLRGILDYFAQAFFGPTRKTRIRPHHFRFTEPSFEIDISCGVCDGTGRVNGEKCRMCKRGWLELGGAGMVHPNVLKAGGIDAAKYSGFAFGWGLERTYMMKEGTKLDDIRLLYKNDLRFLEQF
jgi:phenylalanyl-tRNA synthetase alpha chain